MCMLNKMWPHNLFHIKNYGINNCARNNIFVYMLSGCLLLLSSITYGVEVMEPIYPPDGAQYQSCSLSSPPVFSWNWIPLRRLNIQYSLDNFSTVALQAKINPIHDSYTIKKPLWKKLFTLRGQAGGLIYWRLEGMDFYDSKVISPVFTLVIDGAKPVTAASISPTSIVSRPALSWNNNCATSFKVWFSADSNVKSATKFKKINYAVKDPAANGGQFHNTLKVSDWKVIRNLVNNIAGSDLYWLVESKDSLSRVASTPAMKFMLTTDDIKDDIPEVVVGKFLQAQVAGDVETAMSLLALGTYGTGDENHARNLLEKFEASLKISDLIYRPRATAYSTDKSMAIVRFEHSAKVTSSDGSANYPFGSMAILKNLNGAWKIISFSIDDMLSLELFLKAGGASEPFFITNISKSMPAAQVGVQPNSLLTLQELNTRMDKAMATAFFFNAQKLLMDMAGSGVGYVPGVGDILSNTYTVYDIFSNSQDIWSDMQQGKNTLISKSFTGDKFIFSAYDNSYGIPTDIAIKKHQEWWMPTDSFEIALGELSITSDKWTLEKKKLPLQVGGIWILDRNQGDNIYAAAKLLGVAIDDSLGEAYIPISLTSQSAGPISDGAPILTDFNCGSDRIYFNIGCSRGEQYLSMKLIDGSETYSIKVTNDVFNGIIGARFMLDGFSYVDSLIIDEKSTKAGVKVYGKYQSMLEGGPLVTPADLTLTPCAKLSIADPSIASVAVNGKSPEATLAITGNRSGDTSLDIEIEDYNSGVYSTSIPITVQPLGKAMFGGGSAGEVSWDYRHTRLVLNQEGIFTGASGTRLLNESYQLPKTVAMQVSATQGQLDFNYRVKLSANGGRNTWSYELGDCTTEYSLEDLDYRLFYNTTINDQGNTQQFDTRESSGIFNKSATIYPDVFAGHRTLMSPMQAWVYYTISWNWHCTNGQTGQDQERIQLPILNLTVW